MAVGLVPDKDTPPYLFLILTFGLARLSLMDMRDIVVGRFRTNYDDWIDQTRAEERSGYSGASSLALSGFLQTEARSLRRGTL